MSNETVSALDRGLALMKCFNDTRRVLSPTELSRLTGIPRPSVVRLATTLQQHRWLDVDIDDVLYADRAEDSTAPGAAASSAHARPD